MGRHFYLGTMYSVFPDRKVGITISGGFDLNAYRHYFEKTVFVEQVQKGFVLKLHGRFKHQKGYCP